MDKKIEKKIVLKGVYEDIIKDNNHLYVVHKLNRICVLPFTIATNGVIDKIGVIKELNVTEESEVYTLINGNISQDDQTNLVAANRILFEIIGSNVTSADEWIYLGNLKNISLGDNIIIYAVNITDVDINQSKNVEETKEAMKFEMINSNKVVASDDALFLSSYLRLFNHIYVNSLK